jgi:predicted ATP-grasp superfamily ATP-dependent carboligase
MCLDSILKMENKFVKLIENNNWSDYTFILTSVCVGNVGQLATDLLISSLPNTQKAGYLISSLVQPIVGYNTNRFELSLSVECEIKNI